MQEQRFDYNEKLEIGGVGSFAGVLSLKSP
jgi:hypothetical protein